MIFERLNGWRRIWVVASVLSLAVAAMVMAAEWPKTVEQCIQFAHDAHDEAERYRAADRLAAEAKAKRREELAKLIEDRVNLLYPSQSKTDRKLPVQSTDNLEARDAAALTQDKIEDSNILSSELFGRFDINEASESCSKSVKGQRIQAVLLPLSLWLAFIGVTYLFGWAIGWIARGFTRK